MFDLNDWICNVNNEQTAWYWSRRRQKYAIKSEYDHTWCAALTVCTAARTELKADFPKCKAPWYRQEQVMIHGLVLQCSVGTRFTSQTALPGNLWSRLQLRAIYRPHAFASRRQRERRIHVLLISPVFVLLMFWSYFGYGQGLFLFEERLFRILWESFICSQQCEECCENCSYLLKACLAPPKYNLIV